MILKEVNPSGITREYPRVITYVRPPDELANLYYEQWPKNNISWVNLATDYLKKIKEHFPKPNDEQKEYFKTFLKTYYKLTKLDMLKIYGQ